MKKPAEQALAEPSVVTAETRMTRAKADPLHLGKPEVHFSFFRAEVPLAGHLKQVEYEDLQRVDLLPKTVLRLPAFRDPILFSRFVALDKYRVGGVMYVPSPLGGQYFPRPIYQSSSRGAWQTPNYMTSFAETEDSEWGIKHYGKGIGKRGKTETALSPVLQKFLSEKSSVKKLADLPYDKEVTKVWVGVSVEPRWNDKCDHTRSNQSVKLEQLYKDCKIGPKRISPLPAKDMRIPKEAQPNFKQAVMTYPMHNWVYGDFRGEVYPSQDGKLLWTYYVQDKTQRAWVAHVHAKGSKIVETGLPKYLINIGGTLPLAPYEYAINFKESAETPRLEGTHYLDIWQKYTSKLPMVQAYYQAKGIPCPD